MKDELLAIADDFDGLRGRYGVGFEDCVKRIRAIAARLPDAQPVAPIIVGSPEGQQPRWFAVADLSETQPFPETLYVTRDPMYGHPAQPVAQEAVAWMFDQFIDDQNGGREHRCFISRKPYNSVFYRNVIPLYAFPQPAAQEAARLLSELLAVIHRDGGHYESEHGTTKAVQDAIDKFYATTQSVAQEPVAWEFQHGETGRMTTLSNDGINNPENFIANNPWFQYVGELHRHASPQPAVPDGWDKSRYGYSALFNAIIAAVTLGKSGAIEISVEAFENAMIAAAPKEPT